MSDDQFELRVLPWVYAAAAVIIALDWAWWGRL